MPKTPTPPSIAPAAALGHARSGTVLGRQDALRFIVLLGFVSLFGDMTYESARSITGPYLGTLGASATAVGIVAGLGELVGYAARLGSGWLSDRTGRYWPVTIAGYVLNLFAVPALALAGDWPMAAALMVAERMGRAIRSPARDAMLSHAAGHTGLGWGFGLHEAMDQAGAIIGPLLVAAVLWAGYGYREAFAVLAIPAALSFLVLLGARSRFPRPRDFELAPPALEGRGFGRALWLYLGAVALIGAGYADFALIAYHFGTAGTVGPPLISALYAVAMVSDALAALALGRLFDRHGLPAVAVGASLAALAAPLVFLGGGAAPVALGMLLWGVGMGAQESVMRAVVADMAPPERRGTAYGLLNAVFGVAWFAGSAGLGVLYDHSVAAVAWTSLLVQFAAVPLLVALFGTKRERPHP
ncbi:MFS transporter [Crenalkalicoccus roseus]|uniref:MFS transporter n=1 Tax=Crenalkalicoccus roseus TaxID=1485588 RepID=UPI001958394E|nr:MFS transporter [Crenalkalicoccus roseus]